MLGVAITMAGRLRFNLPSDRLYTGIQGARYAERAGNEDTSPPSEPGGLSARANDMQGPRIRVSFLRPLYCHYT